jgi:hypothetical protein
LKKPENIRLLQQAIACFDDTQAYKQLFLLFYPSLVHFAVSIIQIKGIGRGKSCGRIYKNLAKAPAS